MPPQTVQIMTKAGTTPPTSEGFEAIYKPRAIPMGSHTTAHRTVVTAIARSLRNKSPHQTKENVAGGLTDRA
jgi:hypothetical protein